MKGVQGVHEPTASQGVPLREGLDKNYRKCIQFYRENL
jgi:hypothetical protein